MEHTGKQKENHKVVFLGKTVVNLRIVPVFIPLKYNIRPILRT